jgi:hypothetical protein
VKIAVGLASIATGGERATAKSVVDQHPALTGDTNRAAKSVVDLDSETLHLRAAEEQV